jgi:hypothetical protein
MRFKKQLGLVVICILSISVLSQQVDKTKWRTNSNDKDGIVSIQNGQVEIVRSASYPDKSMLRAYQDINVTPGSVYQLSYQIKVAGHGSGRAVLYFCNKAGMWDLKNRLYVKSMQKCEFTQIKLKFTAPKSRIKVRIDLRAFINDTKVTYNAIQFDDMENITNIDAKIKTDKNPQSPAVIAKLKFSGFFGPVDKSRTLTAIINAENSYKGKYSWQQYKTLLNELSKSRYKVVPLKDFLSTVSSDKIIVAMRHDVDSHPEKALEMMDIELNYGLRSTYLFLHSAKYYGIVKDGVMIRNQGFDELVKEINKNGFEVGIHTDLFTMMWKYQFDPVAFTKAEIAYYNNLGIVITGSAAHGGANVINRKLNNKWIFADFGRCGNVTVNGRIYQYGKYKLSDFGLKYEAYKFSNDLYTGDIDRKYKSLPNPVSGIITKLASLNPGMRVIILTHPEHWGKPQ